MTGLLDMSGAMFLLWDIVRGVARVDVLVVGLVFDASSSASVLA